MKNTYLTIRQTAAQGLVSEHYLRRLVAQGECPGIHVGNRFMVNVPLLAEKLEAMSRECGGEEVRL